MQKTLLAFAAAVAVTGTALAGQAARSFYHLKTTTLVGNKPVDLGSYRGKVTLAVNLAS